jgi:hypothetical protein
MTSTEIDASEPPNFSARHQNFNTEDEISFNFPTADGERTDSTDFSHTTCGDDTLVHIEELGGGASGLVHKVGKFCIYFANSVL